MNTTELLVRNLLVQNFILMQTRFNRLNKADKSRAESILRRFGEDNLRFDNFNKLIRELGMMLGINQQNVCGRMVQDLVYRLMECQELIDAAEALLEAGDGKTPEVTRFAAELQMAESLRAIETSSFWGYGVMNNKGIVEKLGGHAHAAKLAKELARTGDGVVYSPLMKVWINDPPEKPDFFEVTVQHVAYDTIGGQPGVRAWLFDEISPEFSFSANEGFSSHEAAIAAQPCKAEGTEAKP